MSLKKKIQNKVCLWLIDMKEEDVKEATPEEIHEMWEAFYSWSPEDRRIMVDLLKKFFGEIIPPELFEEMEKRIDEKGFI